MVGALPRLMECCSDGVEHRSAGEALYYVERETLRQFWKLYAFVRATPLSIS